MMKNKTTAAAKIIQDLNVVVTNPVWPQNKDREFHKQGISERSAIPKLLISPTIAWNNPGSVWQCFLMKTLSHTTWDMEEWKTVVWSDDLVPQCFQLLAEFMSDERSPKPRMQTTWYTKYTWYLVSNLFYGKMFVSSMRMLHFKMIQSLLTLSSWNTFVSMRRICCISPRLHNFHISVPFWSTYGEKRAWSLSNLIIVT